VCAAGEQLNNFVGGVLVREAVLDYFSASPFYDPTCINELAKAQNVPASQIMCDIPHPWNHVVLSLHKHLHPRYSRHDHPDDSTRRAEKSRSYGRSLFRT
jgi:diadenosine tetraphosphate (Ap4A) HIT family hydrolase